MNIQGQEIKPGQALWNYNLLVFKMILLPMLHLCSTDWFSFYWHFLLTFPAYFQFANSRTFHCSYSGPNFLLDLSSQILFTFCNKSLVNNCTVDRLPRVRCSSLAKLSLVMGRVNSWRWGNKVCFGQCILEGCLPEKRLFGQCRLSEDDHHRPFVVLNPTVFLTSCM